MVYSLIIDTAHPTAGLALVEDNHIIDQDMWPNTPRVSRDLLQRIDRMVKKYNLPLSRIGRIAVHRGPGSYSLLRSGATVASLLSYATGSELVQVDGETVEEMVRQAKTAKPQKRLTIQYKS